MQKSIIGLTLVEVLIALAIVAIAMTAVIKSTSQGLRGTAYLQDKTIAMWISQQILNEIRIGAIKLPADELVTKPMAYLNRQWFWQAKEVTTSNNHISKIDIKIFTQDPEDDMVPLIELETFRYHAT